MTKASSPTVVRRQLVLPGNVSSAEAENDAPIDPSFVPTTEEEWRSASPIRRGASAAYSGRS
jgi:hypothetical protein